MCLWITAGYWFGFPPTRLETGEYRGYFSSLIPLGTLYLLLRQKQAVTGGGRLGLGQGITSGLLASFIAALVVYVFLFVYNQFINPGWLDSALDWKVAQMRAQGLAETDIRKEIVFYRQANSPVGLVVTTLVSMTLMGGIFSLALTLFMQSRSRPPAA